MPTYHFHLSNHDHEADVEGTELPNDAEARTQAVVFAGAFLSDNPEIVCDGERFRVEVTDDSERLLFSVTVEARANE